MRILVQKPVDGRTRVRIDDRKGLTGLRADSGWVAREDVRAWLTAELGKWETARAGIVEARRSG